MADHRGRLKGSVKAIEVRRDPPTRRHPEGDIDEICGRGTFHLERMNDSQIALMLYGESGDVMCVFLEPKVWPKHGNAKHVHARVFWYDTAEERSGLGMELSPSVAAVHGSSKKAGSFTRAK